MTETDISKVLIEGDCATIMGVKYKRVEEPNSFYNKLWYELGKKVGYGIDCDKLTDRIMDLIKDNIKEDGVLDKPKPTTLYDIIADWWDEIFINNNPSGQNIETLVEQIEEWLPKPQSAAGSQNVYVECTVEGFNDCLNKIKRNLR
jgi:hypothetical protein